jgi:hypothetical protein
LTQNECGKRRRGRGGEGEEEELHHFDTEEEEEGCKRGWRRRDACEETRLMCSRHMQVGMSWWE